MTDSPGDSTSPAFEPLALSPFSALLGPIGVRWDPEPTFQAMVREDCANSMGRAHGGFIAALIDIATGQGVKRILGDGRQLVTVTSNVEYLRAARVGEQLRLEVSVEHSTDTLVFAKCQVSVEAKSIAVASSVFSTRPGR